MTVILLILSSVLLAFAQKDPHFVDNREGIVQLFEWKWKDVAKECEDFLQHKGYGAVQISPPNENIILPKRPWYERYQPVSYVINTRSGDEEDFKNMTTRCNAVGVRIFVDLVINHMTASNGIGTAGNNASAASKEYPGVPYNSTDFHETCGINYYNYETVRDCEYLSRKDLNQSTEYVRDIIIDFMNRLIDLGAGGFRIDSAKYIWPTDLEVIYGQLKNLSTDYGFDPDLPPFIYQDVEDSGGEAVGSSEYTGLARVLEYRHGLALGNIFQGNGDIVYLSDFGPQWGFMASEDAVVFIDNHFTQRNGDETILTYKKPREYTMAVAFMLSQNYGIPQVMSSYKFYNTDQGPPKDAEGNLISPIFDGDVSTNGYVAEHRWSQIYNMIGFRVAVSGTNVTNFWSDGDQQIAYCRGDKGFIAFSNGDTINQTLNTCLPAGEYCDVISGSLENGKCTGTVVNVSDDSTATITLTDADGVLALHVNAKQS